MTVTITVELPSWLRTRADVGTWKRVNEWRYEYDLDLPSGSSVEDLLGVLAHASQRFRMQVYDSSSGTVSGDVLIVLNERMIDLAGGIETELVNGDRVAIVQSLAGG